MITTGQSSSSSYHRINIGPIMDGRNVAVADFTGNGLLDIFIVCVTDKHLLLIQTTSGLFEEIFIINFTSLAGGEARGICIGQLYGVVDSLEVSRFDIYFRSSFQSYIYINI